MPPANIDATVIILDIGKNVAVPDIKDEKSFFEAARDCVSRIIERKIMSRPRDLIGLILMGSKKTNNRLADCTDDFRYIESLSTQNNENNEQIFTFEAPNWNLLRKLPEKPTSREADWFEALIVAADALKNGLYGTKVTNKKIVLMTNFKTPANFGDNLEKVIEGFQNEQFQVTVIGPDINSEDYAFDKDTIAVVRRFVEVTEGVATTFDSAMRYLLFHRKKAVNPMPWNVDLSIGPNIKIPVSVYGRTRDETVIQKWLTAVKDPVTNTASTSEGIYKKKEFFKNDDNTAVTLDELVTGYYYGDIIVPFSDNDKSMLYESGPRALEVYGFTKSENITWQALSGNGVSYLFGRKGDNNAQKAILYLIKALQELDLVCVARRVYNNGNAPVMHALIPVIDPDNFYCLSVIGLCYKEDIKNLAFPPTNIKQFTPSDQEVDAFKDLIDSMDLTNAYDESYEDKEAFPIAETVNPSVQYILDCIAFRALNPGKPLPQPRDDIMSLFKMPELVEKRSRDPIERLVKLLNLQEVEKTVKKPKANQSVNPNKVDSAIPSNSNNGLKQETSTSFPNISVYMAGIDDEVTNIGTVDPIGDFKTLLAKGKDFKDLAKELIDVIEMLIYLNFDGDYSNAVSTMRVFREESIKSEPSHYNEWLLIFKKTLIERKKEEVLAILNSENLNLITKEENVLSSVTPDQINDESHLYELDTIANSTELTLETEVMDFFNEM